MEENNKRPAMAVIALVLGILSILSSCAFGAGALFGIIAIILAIVAKKKMNRKDGVCIGGLVTGIVGTVISLIMLLFVGIMGASILPSAMRYTSKSEMSSDISTGTTIASAINASLAVEEVYNDMQAYTDTVYSLSDDYYDLPESFRNEMDYMMGERLCDLEPEYTKNGATGYAFMIDSYSNQVHVYISSGSWYTAWEIYPNVSDDYID
ncbi:MAG: hypothetical protein J6B50_08655 [Lachnospiraceae bacterium]|nr:hypothetical protein [Lachnospiraceae bacterium]